MSNIKSFLLGPVMSATEEVIVTERAKDEEGNPVPFVLRRIDQDTNDRLVQRATRKERRNGQIVERFDSSFYGKLLIQACVIEPDFKDSELCQHYGTMDPLDVPSRMLSSGEYTRLMQAINRFNGFDDLTAEAIEEDAKN